MWRKEIICGSAENNGGVRVLRSMGQLVLLIRGIQRPDENSGFDLGVVMRLTYFSFFSRKSVRKSEAEVDDR